MENGPIGFQPDDVSIFVPIGRKRETSEKSKGKKYVFIGIFIEKNSFGKMETKMVGRIAWKREAPSF